MKAKYLLIILFFGGYSYCQTHAALCPGLKFAMSIDDKIEFVFGYELSLIFYEPSSPEYNYYSIVIDYDYFQNYKRLHFGFQYQHKLVGLELGPTLAWKDSKPFLGFSVVPFGGIFLLPYFNYTYLIKEDHQFEVGSYLKIPIPLQEENFNVGG